MAIGRKRKQHVPEVRVLSLNARSGEALEFRVLRSEATFGSGEESQFVIRRPTVSHRHASLAFRKDHFEISDLGSTNGTFVNGRRVTRPTPVEFGDEIRIGDTSFVLAKSSAASSARSARKRGLPKRVLTTRGAFEAVLIAFAIGFGAAQGLAYLTYHAKNRLILSEAVPINQAPKVLASQSTSNRRAAQTKQKTRALADAEVRGTPRGPSVHPVAPTTPPRAKAPPIAVRTAARAPSSVLNAETVAAKDLSGGVALAQLIEGSGTDAGELAPTFVLPDLDGTDVALRSMRGKVVLLNFWATWCPHCRSEMPSLEKLYQNFRSYRDFALLTVSIDQRGKPAVAQFMATGGYNFPVLLDTSNSIGAAYRVRGVPSTFVIGQDGRIVWNCVGGLDWSDQTLRNALKRLL